MHDFVGLPLQKSTTRAQREVGASGRDLERVTRSWCEWAFSGDELSTALQIPSHINLTLFCTLHGVASALVHVCTNGTVLVTHGGVEMGQGFAYKGCVIPLSSAFLSETSTYKVPNASPTAASTSSDMYDAAVLDVVEQIIAKLEPVASKHNFNSIR
ncbi:unnamed protein product [Arabidopsis thaliana]|uniref:Aldehyde oxidase/xanthine dehydrogenase second molybdopterin binding domain-containing protein n=1 Tax=Arabidopsis thaliana TaxID=3702 RepID=A0A5S9XZX4_ARATH|nr:unnamed protein product [Arabidopsis thaliana]